jgi:F0F1-type ATP synthase membrane subunit a
LLVIAVIINAHLGLISTGAVAAPILIYAFNLLIGVIQAAVFTLLTIAYLITPTQESLEH